MILTIIIVLLCIVAVGSYMFPTILGYLLNSENKKFIILINIFLGWSVIGWCIAIFLCFSPKIYLNGDSKDKH